MSWQKTDTALYRKFEFKDFSEAFSFIKKVAELAESLNHHPKIINSYNVVELELSTHSIAGVTEKDKNLAAKIDELLEKKPTITSGELKVYTDGGSRGNPGPSATGLVIYDMNDNVVLEDGEYIGETTNNQAEYQAIKKAIGLVLGLGAKKLHVFMDSELIIKQLKGEYKVKNQELKPHYDAIKELEKKLDLISYQHVRREFNKKADSLVNQALDDYLG